MCNCATSTKRRLEPCDNDDKQSETLIAWSLPHTADRHNNWSGVYGRSVLTGRTESCDWLAVGSDWTDGEL